MHWEHEIAVSDAVKGSLFHLHKFIGYQCQVRIRYPLQLMSVYYSKQNLNLHNHCRYYFSGKIRIGKWGRLYYYSLYFQLLIIIITVFFVDVRYFGSVINYISKEYVLFYLTQWPPPVDATMHQHKDQETYSNHKIKMSLIH
jgi:hypothetical protein